MSEVNKAITLQQAKTLYDDLRERQENIPSAENIVMVQDQQPTIPANKVWLTETPPAGVDVPTYGEFTGVIAPDYADLDFPVSAGEHCIHNGVLYTAVQNINTSEAWTAAHWEAGSVSSKLTEISSAIQGKYTKPSEGIPDTDLSSDVQTSLGLADTAYQKPNGGIPASDIAEGVIPTVDNALSDSSTNPVQNKVIKSALDGKAPVIINTATGNPVTFNDGGGLPIKNLLIPFSPIQQGSGDPSPSNIRNILPWNGLTVFGGGKNLLNPAKYRFGTTTSQGLTFVAQSDGSVKVTGTTEASDFGPPLSARFQLPAGTYYGFKDEGNVYVTYRKSTEEEGGTTSALISPFTLDGSEWVYCNIYVRNPGTFDTIIHPQIARENAQSSYEPYKPITSTALAFPSPCYGGTLDVVSGVLTVEWALITLNGTEQNWSNYNQGTAFSVPIIGMTTDKYKTVFCDRFAQIKNITSFGVYASASNDYAYFINATDIEGVTDLASWKAYLAENPMGFAYELATPQEIQLTPTQITALVGNNTIWSDADGSMTVEYPADTKTYINNLIATAIASL